MLKTTAMYSFQFLNPVSPPPGVDFTNILFEAFTLADPKWEKRHSSQQCLFFPFGIYKRKKLRVNVDEINPSRRSYKTLFFANEEFLRFLLLS